MIFRLFLLFVIVGDKVLFFTVIVYYLVQFPLLEAPSILWQSSSRWASLGAAEMTNLTSVLHIPQAKTISRDMALQQHYILLQCFPLMLLGNYKYTCRPTLEITRNDNTVIYSSFHGVKFWKCYFFSCCCRFCGSCIQCEYSAQRAVCKAGL